MADFLWVYLEITLIGIRVPELKPFIYISKLSTGNVKWFMLPSAMTKNLSFLEQFYIIIIIIKNCQLCEVGIAFWNLHFFNNWKIWVSGYFNINRQLLFIVWLCVIIIQLLIWKFTMLSIEFLSIVYLSWLIFFKSNFKSNILHRFPLWILMLMDWSQVMFYLFVFYS